MAKLNLNVNGVTKAVDVDPSMPLLWVLRETLGMTGTKYSCGIAQCGACTVHLDGQPIRSCVLPVSAASGRAVTTIEGLATDAGEALKAAWVSEQVPQCGYCQSGQIMAAAALLEANPAPTEGEIVEAMNGNLCRCMAYGRIKAAIQVAAGEGEAQR